MPKSGIVATLLLTLTAIGIAQPPRRHATPWQPVNPAPPSFGILSVALNSSSWTLIGPGPSASGGANGNVSGRITGIAAHPTDANTIYITPAGGGVWKTTNAGGGWTPLTDPQSTLSMGAIAISPSNPSVIYAGTGEANNAQDSNFGRGILVSTNAGASWTLRQGPGAIFNRMAVSAISVHPTDPNTAYAALSPGTENGTFGTPGIYKTINGGITWTNTTAAVDTGNPYSDVKIDLTTPTTVYAAIGNAFGSSTTNGVYKSTNSGSTWNKLLNGPDAATDVKVGRISLAIAKSNSQVLYVSTQDRNTSGVLSVLHSANGGGTFNPVTPPNYMGQQGWYDQAVIVDPSDSAIVIVTGSAGGNSMLRSTNSGGAWSDISGGGVSPHADHHAVAFDANGRFLDGDDGGIYRLEDPAGPTWTDLNGNLSTIQFQGIDLHPTDANQAIGGSQDNGTHRFTGTLAWAETDGGDAGFAKYSPTNPIRVYHQIPQLSFGTNFFRRSDDGGATWGTKTTIIATDVNAQNFYAPFVVYPAAGDHVLYGTNKVWETTDGGDNWTALGGVLGSPCDITTNTGGCINAIGLAPSNTNTIYAGTSNNHLYVTTNHGGAWNDRPIGVNGVIQDIQVDPATSSTAYAVLSSFTGGGNVFRTTNTGTNWTNISGNLPNEPVWSIQIDSANNFLYVGADDGVYRSTDSGTTWNRFGAGLPNAQVFQVVYRPGLNILAAGTHGRSVWEIQTGVLPPTFSKAFGAPTIPLGTSTTLKFTIVNPNGGTALTGVGFTDTLPAGLTASGIVTSVGCPAASMTFTATTITLNPVTIPAGGTCTYTLTVNGATAGVKNNVSGNITSVEGGSGGTASASITVVAPPAIAKAFGAFMIPLGTTTSLKFTITNPNPTVALTGVGFVDNLPVGLVPSGPVTAVGCAASGVTSTATTITGSGISIPASGVCTFTLTITGTTKGVKNNVTTAVTSVEGGNGNTASASITIVAPPVIGKAFGLVAIPVGFSTFLTFTIENPNDTVSLTVGFTDSLPLGIVVSTPNGLTGSCGAGTITATAGSSTISLNNGTIPATGTCTFSVSVTGTSELIVNNSVTVTSIEGGTGNTAAARLVVGEVFATKYAANLDIGDSFINLTNTGLTGGFDPAGNICANVYVLDPAQEVVACCSCPMTPNHLKSLSVRNDLISNLLTPGVPTSITTVVLASSTCNAAAPGNLALGLRGWGTTLHARPSAPVTYGVTETPFSATALSASELSKLTVYCGFIQANGSHFGICKSCQQGALGAEHQ